MPDDAHDHSIVKRCAVDTMTPSWLAARSTTSAWVSSDRPINAGFYGNANPSAAPPSLLISTGTVAAIEVRT